jgi:sulfite exporter TauE/SafE
MILFSALVLGLVSSLHCIGMCGPIALMLPVDQKNPTKKAAQILLYHLGRLTSYGFLGFVFGWLGRGFYLAGYQQQLSIIVGILMILFVVIPEKQLAKYTFSKPIYILISKVKSHLGNQFKRRSPDAFYTIGLFNGLLPCGLVYVALFGAIAMNNVGLSTLFMLLFGIGTVPMMSVIVYISNFISNSVRSKIQKAVPILIIIVGSMFIVRGMGLDIPYLSPNTLNLQVKNVSRCH